jgi:hypothetical protein
MPKDVVRVGVKGSAKGAIAIIWFVVGWIQDQSARFVFCNIQVVIQTTASCRRTQLDPQGFAGQDALQATVAASTQIRYLLRGEILGDALHQNGGRKGGDTGAVVHDGLIVVSAVFKEKIWKIQ